MALSSKPPAKFYLSDPNWESVWPFPFPASPHSFISGTRKNKGVRIAYYRLKSVAKSNRLLVGKVWFGPHSEGPPGSAHGGSIAAVLDEAMGGLAWMLGHPVVAAQITVNFKRMIAIGSVVRLEARINKIAGKKIFVFAKLTDDQGRVLGQSKGLMISVGFKNFSKHKSTRK